MTDGPGPGESDETEVAATMREQLSLDVVGDDRFRSTTPTSSNHVFGGLLLAQALRAATATVEGGRPVHAVHGSFLAAGRPGRHLDHRVERTRDGASFATRRVTTGHDDDTTFVATTHFHHDEQGADYSTPRADVPGPHDLAPGRYDNPLIENRDVPVGAAADRQPLSRHAWFRVRRPLGDDPALHAQTLLYLSDFGATRAVREPHAHLADDARRQSVSLDHSVWFHRPADVTGWILSSLWPMATAGGRGLAIGTLRTEDGTLLATIAQQALLRSL